MSTYEHNALQQYKDQNGDMHIVYPVTKAENVDGLYEGPTLTGIPKAPTAEAGTNTTQIATTEFVQTELTEVKKSVSDGKTTVANAITAKGVTTATDATFAVMAENISQIESGIDTSDATATATDMLTGKTAYVNGEKVTGTMANQGAVSQTLNAGGSYTIPAGYHNGHGKVTAKSPLNLFTQTTEPVTKDGVWIKTSGQYSKAIITNDNYYHGDKFWTSVSNLPYNFYAGSAVVFNNEIHILGGNGGTTKHYKWNGSSWTSVSTLPYSFTYGLAVVFNNEIHILGGTGGYTKHYKWGGSSWTSVSTLPYNFHRGSVVVFNNEIHILGTNTSGNYTKHYKWNGSSWTSASTLPYDFYLGSAVVFNNEIHILGGNGGTTKHYKWNGSSWTSVSTLPYKFVGSSAIVFNNEIHILGSNYDNYVGTNHYKWNRSSWTSVSTLPYILYYGSAVVYNGYPHILGSSKTSGYTKHYKDIPITDITGAISENTIIINQLNSNATGSYAAELINGVDILAPNNKFPSGFDDIIYVGSSGVENVPMYYGNGSEWIKFKN